jgi:uncharacterized protein YbbK (DUF523 family)/uncharacterized protein YbgA (DUF1722 family)
MKRIKIGISACLLGIPVRYDGGHRLDHYLTFTLGRHFQWVPICPEVEAGMPVPREPMRLEGKPPEPKLITKDTGLESSWIMKKWINKKLNQLKKKDLCGFVFKSGSPSCGIKGVKVYDLESGSVRMGKGLFASAFIKAFPYMPVEDEVRLQNPEIRENFIERVLSFKAWKDLTKKGMTKQNLIEFHKGHKLQIMSHSHGHLQRLERLLKRAGRLSPSGLSEIYLSVYADALKLKATKNKHYRVFKHIIRHVEKNLLEDEKKALFKIMNDYLKEKVSIAVPVTLLKHYTLRFAGDLARDFYLDIHLLPL